MNETRYRWRRSTLVGALVFIAPAVALSVLGIVRVTHATARPDASSQQPATSSSPTPPVTASIAPKDPFKIVVFGDSTANSIGWTMRGVQKPGVNLELLGKDGCTMLYDACNSEEWTTRMEALEPNAAIVFLGGAFMHEMAAKSGDYVSACHPEWDAKLEGVLTRRFTDLSTTIAKKTTAARKTRVFALTIPYTLGSFGGDEIRGQIACINKSIRKTVSAVSGVEMIDLAEHVCPKGECTVREPGVTIPIRPDGVHFHMEGANLMSAWVLDQIATEL